MCAVSFSAAATRARYGWMRARRSSASENLNAVASSSVPRKYGPPGSGWDTNLRYFRAARMRCSELFGTASRLASSSSDSPRGASPTTASTRSARSMLATGDSVIPHLVRVRRLPYHSAMRNHRPLAGEDRGCAG